MKLLFIFFLSFLFGNYKYFVFFFDKFKSGDELFFFNFKGRENIWDRNELFTIDFNVENAFSTIDFFMFLGYDVTYSNSNLFIKYSLFDAKGSLLEEGVKDYELFDIFDGVPKQLRNFSNNFFGKFILISDKSFDKKGMYRLKVQHFMRSDFVTGINWISIKLKFND